MRRCWRSDNEPMTIRSLIVGWWDAQMSTAYAVGWWKYLLNRCAAKVDRRLSIVATPPDRITGVF